MTEHRDDTDAHAHTCTGSPGACALHEHLGAPCFGGSVGKGHKASIHTWGWGFGYCFHLGCTLKTTRAAHTPNIPGKKLEVFWSTPS